MKRFHVAYDKDGLVRDVTRLWPVDWLTDGEGRPYPSLAAAVQAVQACPTPYIPIACPTPNEEGLCPGHEDTHEEDERLAEEMDMRRDLESGWV